MKKKVFSKSMSWILSVVMLFGVFVIMNTANIEANASSKMTLSQLKQKFPSGKYWNHAGSSSNNPDGYTSTPCTHHGNCSKNGTDYSGWCGCNSFGSSIQCFGFANKLAYDAFGSLYTSWSKTSLSNLKAGDVIRYKNNGHSIFVTGVSGDTITYGDCNSDGHCKIRWDATISKSTVSSTLTAVYSAPSTLSTDGSILAPDVFYGLSKVDRGTNFYGLIIRNENWAHISDENGDVKVNNNGNIVWYFTKTSDGGYKIRNVATGKYLDVNGGYDKDDNNVQTWEPNDTAAQVWYIYGPWSGEYVFKPKCTSNKVLNVYGPTGDATTWTFNPDDKDMRFALWDDISTYTVSYNMNGGSGSIANQTKVQYSPLTLSGTKPTRTGYEFVVWNTNASATTAQYQPSGKYTANSGATLYAIWKANTYTVSYNMNGGSGSIGNQTKTYGQDLTLSSTKPTRTGYSFLGWNTNKSATTAQYQPGGKYTANSAATLYAIWKINTWTVSYNMNGGSGSISNQTKTYGQDLTLSSTKPIRTGYDFVGWNTSASATTAQYSSGGKYTANSGATLYAIWKAKQVTVTFYRNLNSDDTTTASQIFTYGVSGQSFSNKNWSRNGYTLIGWSENRSATDKQYSTLSSVDPNWIISKSPKVNLYAVWKESGYVMSESEGAGRTIPDGDYYIISELNQDFFIDIPGNDFDTANGKNVQMWIWNSLMPPKEGYDCFRIEYLNNGFYKITQIGTNMCLDVSGGSLLKGTNVQMWKYDGAKSQQWSIEKTSHGYRIRSRCNAYCLDIADGKHENGRNIRCWDANNARCQSFGFIPRKLDEKPISDGVYTIKTNVNKSRACSHKKSIKNHSQHDDR